ncbi:MAG: MFS transporter [Betaproteobacteria bacterium]
MTESSTPRGGLWLRLFLPFAAGYFLSYLYRTVNAVIGPVLSAELSLGDGALGLLTATYFLTFSAAQVPLGMLLDKYGPRRVESVLLLIAAIGAVVFAYAPGLATLAFGRALIGLGVSACLMATFTAFARWYPPQRLGSLSGLVMIAGGLGALAAAQPVQWALGITTWRGICLALAVVTVAVAVLLWLLAPDKPTAASRQTFREQLAGVRSVFGSRIFWRYAPAAFWMVGGFMALQGLWVARWMSVLEGLERSDIAQRLTLMNLAMLGGFAFLGFLSPMLVRRGFTLERMYVTAIAAAVVAQATICWQPGAGGVLPWAVLGFCFALSNIAFTQLTLAFAPELAGRANTALNLYAFGGAFVLQWGVGSVVELAHAAGATTAYGLRVAFVVILAGQVLSLIWLLRSTGSAAAVRSA